MSKQHKHISKLMSLILRHKPEHIGAKLDENGWLTTEELITGINKKGMSLDLELLKTIVEENDKQRFVLSDDNSKIRANQGHSIEVNLEMEVKTPPEFLYHGTVQKFIQNIKEQGLLKMNRQHVHLSADRETAIKVGQRRGKPIILSVRAGDLYRDGMSFYQSKNGVWLTDHVPSTFIEFK